MLDRLTTCRCCLAEVKKDQELYEFSSEVAISENSDGEFVRIVEAFASLTNILVPYNEEDTTKICSPCLQELKVSYVFLKKCLDSDQVYKPKLFVRRKGETQAIIVSNALESYENYAVVKQEESEMNLIEYVEEEYLEPIGYLQEDDVGIQDDEGSQYEVLNSPDSTRHQNIIQSNVKRIKFEENTEECAISCDDCGKSFDRKEYYRRHYRRLHLKTAVENAADKLTEEGKLNEIANLQLYQCEHCGKIEVIKEDFDEHVMQHVEIIFKCRHCNLNFTSKDVMRDHIAAMHGSEKEFICDVCGKGFKNKYSLMLHYRRHTGEKPYRCHICNRSFSMSSNLAKHIESHSETRPYNCEVCGQFFKTPRSLKSHIICFHNTEEKIKCPDCEKTFVNKSYLKMHQQYHTGEKNFTCTLCNGKYYKTSHLKRHVQNVHFKMRLLKCDFCASDFVRKETYKAHVINHHKRHLSPEVFDSTIEKIRNFRPPALDINQFILEKQKFKTEFNTVVLTEDGSELCEVMEEVDTLVEEMPEIDYENEENEMAEDYGSIEEDGETETYVEEIPQDQADEDEELDE